jgi:hypothetical protein
MSSIRALLALGLIALFCSTAGAAQERIFPAVRSFELPEASPRVYGVVGRIISTRRGESRFGNEREGEVVLGENVPLVAIKRGSQPIVLGVGSQVYGRFSLDDAKTALISVDWVATLNTTAQLGAVAVTMQLYHESSHLGDEYGDRFDASRLDWTREVLGAWLTYGTGPLSVTGNLSYVLVDELDLDRPGAALAADWEGRPFGSFLGGRVRPIGGVFFEGTAATSWRVSSSAKLGVALAGGTRGREVGIALIAHDGLSTQRQFFRRESRYIGAELRFDL